MARTVYYFVAILVPEPFATEINAFKAEMLTKYQCKTALKSDPHLTLFAPFLWNEQREFQIMDALIQLKSEWKSSAIKLHGFGCFKPRVIYVHPTIEPFVYTFQQTLLNRLQSTLQLKQKFHPGRTFQPHVTIANRDIPLDKFDEAWDMFKNRTYEAIFNADTLSLLKHDGLRWNTHFEIKAE